MSEDKPFYYSLNPCFNLWKEYPLYRTTWKKEEGNIWTASREEAVHRYIACKDETDIKTYYLQSYFK